MSQPAISVVVPLYNKRPYVLRCLDSIRRQSMAGFEAIVVDDGSSDGGGSVVSQVSDQRFRLVAQANRGASAARNRGIAESHADLIAFLDADDEWDPAFLEGILALAHRYPESGLFASGFRRCYGGLRPDRETTISGSSAQLVTDYFRCACEGDLVTSSSVAVRKAVFAQIGAFPEGAQLGEDRDMWARIALRYPIGYDNRILATYHMAAAGRTFDRWKTTLPYPTVVHSLRQALLAPALHSAKDAEVERYLEFVLMKYAKGLLVLGDRSTSRQVLGRERFRISSYRREAALLRVALAILPTRLIVALDARRIALVVWMRELVRRSRAGAPDPARRPNVITYDSARPHACCAGPQCD
jgi:glycosyltransferase involved in cell wall biosynthesis